MRTNFFCTNFLNTPRGPGNPGKIPGTSQIPLIETQGRQTFEGGHELFGHHPFAWKTPTPPGGLRTQKVNLCALFSGLKPGLKLPGLGTPKQSPAEPSERPRRTLGEIPQNPRRDPTEPSERPLQSLLRDNVLGEPSGGCAPRMVTLRNFRIHGRDAKHLSSL